MVAGLERIREYIDALVTQHGLGHRRREIMESLKPSYQLILTPGEGRVGESRFGGVPDLPNGEAWPMVGSGRLRRPIDFMGQINLREIEPTNFDLLPRHGVLSFFYDLELQVDAGGTEDRPFWRVLYWEDERALQRMAAPEDFVRIAPPHRVGFMPVLTVPALRSIERDALGLSDNDDKKYWDFRDAVLLMSISEITAPIHRVLGHPDGFQGCMQRQVQFVSRDIELPAGIYSYYEHPRAGELIPGAFDWRLLLQIDSDERLKWMFGDAGRVYFWLHRESLERQEFGEAWCFMQCG